MSAVVAPGVSPAEAPSAGSRFPLTPERLAQIKRIDRVAQEVFRRSPGVTATCIDQTEISRFSLGGIPRSPEDESSEDEYCPPCIVFKLGTECCVLFKRDSATIGTGGVKRVRVAFTETGQCYAVASALGRAEEEALRQEQQKERLVPKSPGLFNSLLQVEVERRQYVVSKLYDGDLTSLREEQDRFPQFLNMFPRIVCALEQMHRNGLAHGDLKPGNVFFDKSSGEPVIADYGFVSRAIEGATEGLDQTGGTPGYASPEYLYALQEHDKLQERYDELQQAYDNLPQRYDNLQERCNELRKRYDELQQTHNNKDCYILVAV